MNCFSHQVNIGYLPPLGSVGTVAPFSRFARIGNIPGTHVLESGPDHKNRNSKYLGEMT
jgi:hypothetical protein